MDVEKQLMVAVREAFVELLSDLAVGRTDVMRNDVTQGIVDIEHLGQFSASPVV